MTFVVGNINIALYAACNWQLEAGRFSWRKSHVFGTRLSVNVNELQVFKLAASS